MGKVSLCVCRYNNVIAYWLQCIGIIQNLGIYFKNKLNLEIILKEKTVMIF